MATCALARRLLIASTLAACAFMLAGAATRLVARAPARDVRSFAPRMFVEPRRAKTAELLLRLFDARAPHSRGPSEPSKAFSSVACEGSARLVASVRFAPAPERSLAAIRRGGETQVYELGDDVDGREIVDIRTQDVWLRVPGRDPCQLTMFSPRPSTVSHATRGQIEEVRPGRYRVPRPLFDAALAGGASLARGTRVVPYERAGQFLGLRIHGVAPGSVLSQLGFSGGDVLRSINGIELSSPDAALSAYALLRDSHHFEVLLERADVTHTLAYTVE